MESVCTQACGGEKSVSSTLFIFLLGRIHKKVRRYYRATAAANSGARPTISKPTAAIPVISKGPRKDGSANSPIKPNKPMILPKTSTTRILTNKLGSAASASAAVDPVMPTDTPQSKLQSPTVRPPQKSAKPNGDEEKRGQ